MIEIDLLDALLYHRPGLQRSNVTRSRNDRGGFHPFHQHWPISLGIRADPFAMNHLGLHPIDDKTGGSRGSRIVPWRIDDVRSRSSEHANRQPHGFIDARLQLFEKMRMGHTHADVGKRDRCERSALLDTGQRAVHGVGIFGCLR